MGEQMRDAWEEEAGVDVGCGEGRLAREMIARGHAVVGIEGSSRLAAAALAAEPAPAEVHVADAALMPLGDGVADLAVASVSLHDAHRPLRAYFVALERDGLLVEALREPVPDAAHLAAHPEVAGWLQRPCFLLVRAVKPA